MIQLPHAQAFIINDYESHCNSVHDMVPSTQYGHNVVREWSYLHKFIVPDLLALVLNQTGNMQ